MDSLVNSEGVAHLAYHISGLDDVVNRYSVQDFELLNPEFEDFLSHVSGYLPDKAPIVLELTGASLTKDEQARVDNAIWNHFLLDLSENKLKIKRALRRTIWYIFCTLVSAFLVYLASVRHFDDGLTMILYLPIWYFGYRVLTYPILDCIPIWKENQKLKQFAVLHLKFSPDGPGELTASECEAAKKTYQQYYSNAEADTRHGKMIENYLMEGNTVDLEAHVSSKEDIIRPSSIPDFEFLTDGLLYYLSQAEKFIRKNTPVKFTISGATFTEDEQSSIRRALNNHAAAMENDLRSQLSTTKKKIGVFAFFLAIAVLCLSVFGPSVDVALHEMIVIFLWFFGDYLIEFTLIDYMDQSRALRSIQSLRNLQVTFKK